MQARLVRARQVRPRSGAWRTAVARPRDGPWTTAAERAQPLSSLHDCGACGLSKATLLSPGIFAPAPGLVSSCGPAFDRSHRSTSRIFDSISQTVPTRADNLIMLSGSTLSADGECKNNRKPP